MGRSCCSSKTMRAREMRATVCLSLSLVGMVLLCDNASSFVFTPFLAVERTRSLALAQASSYASCTFPAHRVRASSALKMADGDFDEKATMASAQEKMEKSTESVQNSLETLRTGRASPKVLDRVTVECYGVETPLNQVASVKTSSATQLLVESYDPAILDDIATAIQESDVGLTPNNDGSVIRLNLPPVTEERRKDLAKEAKALGEEGKVAIRNIRRDAVEAVKKAQKSKSLGKDQSKDAQDAIQKLTDKFAKVIDEKVAAKEKDILKV
ncbi:unnamed protein product [Ascophyllum nodosum]